MTTLAELIDTPPAAGEGLAVPYVHGAGAWRFALQFADPSAGASVAWLDQATPALLGYNVERGAGLYAGRWEACVANIELKGIAGQFAPYNADTSPTFGSHVDLGPGLLVRGSLFRVASSVVAEWLPRFTLKVEYWGDAAHARGSVRRHLIVARDLLTSLVDVPVPAQPEQDWRDRVAAILDAAGWQYGLSISAGVSLTLPARDEQASASTELDATLDPVGLTWFVDRFGRLVIRPKVGDTQHGAVYTAPTAHFSYAATDASGLIAYAVDSAQAEAVGICKTEEAVKNRVVITSPAGTFDQDDGASVTRFDPHVYRTTWLAGNDPAALDILNYLAWAQHEATPLVTTIRQPGFYELMWSDWLFPAELDYRASGDESAVSAAGVIRRYEEQARFAGSVSLEMSLRTTLDIATATDAAPEILPVEDLAADSVDDTTATFSWTNPAGQPTTPTHTQVRLIGATAIWTTLPYPIVGLAWASLTPGTPYQFQVRLVEITAGLITASSSSRVVNIVTTDLTTPGGGGSGGDVDVPDYTPCDTDWRLEEWDPATDTWTLTASGSVLGPGPVDVSSYVVAGTIYRVGTRENCSGVTGPWVYGPSWIEPDDWGDPCITPPAFDDAPFDDPNLVAYVGQLCAPATIREAVSGLAAEKGPAFQVVTNDSDGRPKFWSTAEGVVLQGAQSPALGTLETDATLCWRGKLGAQPADTVILAQFAGLAIEAETDGAGWAPTGVAYEQVGGRTAIFGATTIPLDTETWVNITHDTATDSLRLYIGGALESSSLGLVGLRDPGLGGSWVMELPADSWAADVATFDRVLAAGELPGPQPPQVTVNVASGQADPTTEASLEFDIVFSEAVSGFAASDVTLSGTATGTLAKSITGTGPAYVLHVTGMTGAGTVVASIAAGVCTSVATGLGNEASTSTDNSILWSPSFASVVAAIGKAQIYWKLTETSGTTIVNYTALGAGWNGTLSGAVTLNSTTAPDGLPAPLFGGGKVQSAGSLTETFINAAGALGAGISVVARIKQTAARTEWLITNTRATPRYHYGFQINGSTGASTFTHWGQLGSTRSTANGSAGAHALNTWETIHVSIADDALDSDIKIYFDSTTDVAGTETHSANDAEDLAGNFIVGARADGAANPFTGYVRDVVCFKPELTSGEWAQLLAASQAEGF